jgi:O-antigen ligase
VLIATRDAIIKARSLKLPLMMIVAALALVCFLALPRKLSFLVAMTGFSLPFFIRLTIMERGDDSLSLTGTSIVAFILGLMLVAALLEGTRQFIIEIPITLFFMAYLGVCALSMVNTTDRTLSLLAMSKEAEMLIIFLILVNTIQDKSSLRSFLRGLFAAFAIECIIFVIQNMVGFSFDVLGNRKFVGATDVESGYIGSQRGTFDAAPAVAALYFSLLSQILIGFYLCRERFKLMLTPVLGVILGVGCLALGAKRAPMSGFVLGMVTTCLLLARYSPREFRKVGKIAAAVLIPVIVFAPVLLLRAEANHESAYEERMNLTRVAWEMWRAHPVIGVGVGTYDTVKRMYLPEDWVGWLYTVHNNYLMVIAETGALGLGMLILFYLVVLRKTYQGIEKVSAEYRPMQICLIGALVAIYWEMYWDIFDSKQQEYMLWTVVALAVIFPRIFKEGSKAAAS